MAKRYLIRAGFDPFKNYSRAKVFYSDPFGRNAGNLMFPYGVMNVLCTSEDVRFDSTHYRKKWTDSQIERINSEYDAFLIPLADAFREDFMPQLTALTDLVRRLKIPCIVIGCGLRAPINPDPDASYPFDDTARKFVRAVLERSQCLGLRGGNTYAYLEKLGFRAEADFTVIGCPSLYAYGNSVVTKPVPEKVRSIAYNINYLYPEIGEKIADTALAAERSECVWQIVQEFRHLYLNQMGPDRSLPEAAMRRIHERNGGAFFWRVPEWIEYVSRFDLFVGDRFHGVVAAVLAGVPEIMIPMDSRTQELTEYHHLTSVDAATFLRTDSVYELLDRLDFTSFQKNQKANLDHFHSFLKTNGLESCLDDPDRNLSHGNAVFEKELIRTAREQSALDSFLCAGQAERMRRKAYCCLYSAARKTYRKFRY